MNRSGLAFASVILAVFVGACEVNPVPKVAERAAFDMNCPTNQIAVTQGDGCTYYARGCGVKAAYIVRAKNADAMVCCPPIGCDAVLNGAVTKDVPVAN